MSVFPRLFGTSPAPRSSAFRCALALLGSAPLLLTSLSAVGCVDISAGGARYTETVEKRYSVNGMPTLDVGIFDGSVDVSTWDRPEVLITIEKYGLDKAAADRILVTTEQDGERIRVDVREARDGGFHLNFGSSGARVALTVPVRTEVGASTGDGRVSVRDVEGNIRVRTGDGSIQIEHVTGNVSATSGDGSIDVEGSIPQLTLRSGDGRLHVRASGAAPAGDWMLATGDGSVVLELPTGFGAELDAATGDGRVRVQDLPFSGTSGRSDRGVARGRIGSGGGRVSIRSGDGSITVRASGV